MSKADVLAVFKEIKNGNIQRHNDGLCHNATLVYKSLYPETPLYLNELYGTVGILSKTWYHFSGCSVYPVKPHTQGYNTLFDLKYKCGQLRLSLLDHIISELELPDVEFNKKYYQDIKNRSLIYFLPSEPYIEPTQPRKWYDKLRFKT